MASQGLDQLAQKWGATTTSSSASSGGSSLDQLSEKWSAPSSPTKTVSKPTPTSKPQTTIIGNNKPSPSLQQNLLGGIGSVFKGVVGEIGSIIHPQAPKPLSTPKVTSTNLGGGLRLDLVPSQQNTSAQTTITPKSIQGQKQVVQNVQAVKQNAIRTLPETSKMFKEAQADPFSTSLKSSPKEFYDTVVKSVTDAWTQANQRAADLQTLRKSKTATPSEKIGKGLLNLSGEANLALSPLSGIFTASNKVPYLATLTKALTVPFTILGEGAPQVTNKLIDKIPTSIMSQKVKNDLKPGVGEIFALATQLLVPGAGEKLLSGKKMIELKAKYGPEDAKTIVDQSQKLADEKKQQLSTLQGTHNPQDIRNKVFQLGIENSPIGKGILKATVEAEQANKGVQISQQLEVGTKTVPITKVETGLSDLTAGRVKTDTPKIKAYEKSIKNGEKLPPVPVYEENGKYVLNKDGFHRYQAQKNLGVENIDVKVEPKTELSGSAKQRVENKPIETSRPKEQDVYYHSTNTDGSRRNNFYITKNEEYSKEFGKKLSKLVPIKTLKEFDGEKIDTKYLKENNFETEKEAYQKLKDEGYDVIKFNYPERSLVLNKNAFINISDAVKPEKAGPLKKPVETVKTPSAGAKEKPIEISKNSNTGPSNPVGQGQVKESSAFKHRMERLAETDPGEYKLLHDEYGKITYNVNRAKDDTAKASALLEKDPQEAYDVAMGHKPTPEGQSTSAVALAVSDRAAAEGRFDVVGNIESNMTLRLTRGGQESAALRGRFNENSAHTYMKQVLDERLKRIGSNFITKGIDTAKALKSAKQKAIAKIDEQVAKAREYTKKERAKITSAQSLLDKLVCK